MSKSNEQKAVEAMARFDQAVRIIESVRGAIPWEERGKNLLLSFWYTEADRAARYFIQRDEF